MFQNLLKNMPDILNNYLDRTGTTKSILAERLDISRQKLYSILSGDKDILLDTINKLEALLNELNLSLYSEIQAKENKKLSSNLKLTISPNIFHTFIEQGIESIDSDNSSDLFIETLKIEEAKRLANPRVDIFICNPKNLLNRLDDIEEFLNKDLEIYIYLLNPFSSKSQLVSHAVKTEEDNFHESELYKQSVNLLEELYVLKKHQEKLEVFLCESLIIEGAMNSETMFYQLVLPSMDLSKSLSSRITYNKNAMIYTQVNLYLNELCENSIDIDSVNNLLTKKVDSVYLSPEEDGIKFISNVKGKLIIEDSIEKESTGTEVIKINFQDLKDKKNKQAVFLFDLKMNIKLEEEKRYKVRKLRGSLDGPSKLKQAIPKKIVSLSKDIGDFSIELTNGKDESDIDLLREKYSLPEDLELDAFPTLTINTTGNIPKNTILKVINDKEHTTLVTVPLEKRLCLDLLPFSGHEYSINISTDDIKENKLAKLSGINYYRDNLKSKEGWISIFDNKVIISYLLIENNFYISKAIFDDKQIEIISEFDEPVIILPEDSTKLCFTFPSEDNTFSFQVKSDLGIETISFYKIMEG